jgi:hypothetical protein
MMRTGVLLINQVERSPVAGSHKDGHFAWKWTNQAIKPAMFRCCASEATLPVPLILQADGATAKRRVQFHLYRSQCTD